MVSPGMVEAEVESCRCLAVRFLDQHIELQWWKWIRFYDETPAETRNWGFRVFAWNTSFVWGQDRIWNGRDGSGEGVSEVRKIAVVADCRHENYYCYYYCGDDDVATVAVCPSSLLKKRGGTGLEDWEDTSWQERPFLCFRDILFVIGRL